MASKAPLRLLTPRDLEILTALDHCPLTARQLLKLSRTFECPFPNERRLRDRLQALGDAGRVRRWQYATASRGAPNYYTLSPLGYRLLHGEGAIPPTKRAFSPVGIAQQHHTQSLADFIVHTIIAAHRAGVRFTGFYRENTLRLAVGDECLYPDCGFQLVAGDGQEFGFVVEVDAGTERIRSPKDLDSWERKIRLYDRFQDSCVKRFRVLIISTRSSGRVEHILDAAATLVGNPRRSLFYGLSLTQYLTQADSVVTPCFRDHRGRLMALVPRMPRVVKRMPLPRASKAVS